MTACQHKDSNGYVWHKFTCSFKSPDGCFAFELWGISYEHAVLQLASLKETAAVDGQVKGEIPA